MGTGTLGLGFDTTTATSTWDLSTTNEWVDAGNGANNAVGVVRERPETGSHYRAPREAPLQTHHKIAPRPARASHALALGSLALASGCSSEVREGTVQKTRELPGHTLDLAQEAFAPLMILGLIFGTGRLNYSAICATMENFYFHHGLLSSQTGTKRDFGKFLGKGWVQATAGLAYSTLAYAYFSTTLDKVLTPSSQPEMTQSSLASLQNVTDITLSSLMFTFFLWRPIVKYLRDEYNDRQYDKPGKSRENPS